MFLTAKCQVLIKFNVKNSKVFEQKGNLLNFKANIDRMDVLSQAEPSCQSFFNKLLTLSTNNLDRIKRATFEIKIALKIIYF